MDSEYENRIRSWGSNSFDRAMLDLDLPQEVEDRLTEIARTEEVDPDDLVREGIMRVLDDRGYGDGGEGAPVPAHDLPSPPEAHATAEEPIRF